MNKFSKLVTLMVILASLLLTSCLPSQKQVDAQSTAIAQQGQVINALATQAFLPTQTAVFTSTALPLPSSTPIPTKTSTQTAISTAVVILGAGTVVSSVSTQPVVQSVGTGCPTEAEFEALVGVRADIDRTEACAFHWRGDPKTLSALHPCPSGWVCTLGVDHKNYVYTGDSNLTALEIFSGTWRMISPYPAGDAVYNHCDFLKKVQNEGAISNPQWTASAGNFICQ